MSLRRTILLAASLTFVLAATSRADTITYTFTTNVVIAGVPLSGSFTVPDSAITDGIIEASEITSYLFTHGTVIFGDNPADVLEAFGNTGAGFLDGIPVDPLTGVMVFSGQLNMCDFDTATPNPVPCAQGNGGPSFIGVQTGLPPGENHYDNLGDPGLGTWTCSHDGVDCAAATTVPEPGSLSLVGTALIIGLVPLLRRKAR